MRLAGDFREARLGPVSVLPTNHPERPRPPYLGSMSALPWYCRLRMEKLVSESRLHGKLITYVPGPNRRPYGCAIG